MADYTPYPAAYKAAYSAVYASTKARPRDGVGTPVVQLSVTEIAEDAAVNDVVGVLSVTNLGVLTVSSYSITSDPDNKFAISGSNLIIDQILDYETKTFHYVTVQATLSDASTVSRVFTITVTDVVSETFAVYDQTVEFGALTVNGEGAAIPVYTSTPTSPTWSIQSGNAANHWTINASTGALTPTVTGDTADLNGGPYSLGVRCVCSEGTFDFTWTVVTTGTSANGYNLNVTRSVATLTELKNRVGNSGGTVLLRPGTYESRLNGGNGNWNNKFSDNASMITIASHDRNNMARIDQFALVSTAAPTSFLGNVTIEYIHFDALDYTAFVGSPPSYTGGQNNYMLHIEGNTTSSKPVKNVIVRNCIFDGNVPDGRTWENAIDPWGSINSLGMIGVWTKYSDTVEDNILIEDCVFEHLTFGVVIGGSGTTVQNCEFRYMWSDAGRIYHGTVAGYNFENIRIRNNYLHDILSNHGLHPDFWQLAKGASSVNIDDVIVEGNVSIPGDTFWSNPGSPGGNNGVDWARMELSSSNFTADPNDVYATGGGAGSRFPLYRVDTRSSAVTVTLPAASGLAANDNCGIMWWGGANALTVNVTGSDTVIDQHGNSVSMPYVYDSVPRIYEWKRTGASQWTRVERGPSLQGHFDDNPPAVGTGLTFRYNIFYVTTIHGISLNETEWSGTTIYNNTVLCDYSATEPWSNYYGSAQPATIRLAGNNNVIRGNLVGQIDSTGTGDTEEANIETAYWQWSGPTASIKHTGTNSVSTDLSPASTTTAQLRPTTKAQAIAYARPNATGRLYNKGIGALASDAANDPWDYSTGALKRNTPYYVLDFAVTAGAGGYSASWKAPSADGGSAVTGYTLQENVNGAGWVNASGYTSGTSYAQTAYNLNDSIQVRVRANNANGNGLYSEAITVTALAPVVTNIQYQAGSRSPEFVVENGSRQYQSGMTYVNT